MTATPAPGAPEVLTASEVAKLLRVDRKTVYEAAQRGRLLGLGQAAAWLFGI